MAGLAHDVALGHAADIAATRMVFVPPSGDPAIVLAACEGLFLADYAFDRYKVAGRSKKNGKADLSHTLNTLDLSMPEGLARSHDGYRRDAFYRFNQSIQDFFNASGMATPDDLTEFDSCQTGYAGRAAAWQEFDRGMARRIVGPDDVAREFGFEPVVSARHFADETLYHGEYRQWLKMMSEGLSRERAVQAA